MERTRGFISVIHGPMFSGKTEELLRRIRRARVARKNCLLFKPTRDQRYSPDRVLPHSLATSEHSADLGEQALSIATAREILEHTSPAVNLVGIEEAQFFDEDLFLVVQTLTARGVDVVLSLLDQDFRRQPFAIPESNRSVGDYLAIAHESLKLTAICVQCGREAQHSQKLVFVESASNGEPVYAPASFHDEVVAVGAGRDSKKREHPRHIYEARCLECHEVPDEPSIQPEPAQSARPEQAIKTKVSKPTAPRDPAVDGEDVLLVDANDEERAAAASRANEQKAEKKAEEPASVKKPANKNSLPDLLELAD